MTQADIYTQKLVDMFENDVMSVELIGTQGKNKNKHEGRGGWSTSQYVNESKWGNFTNPFYNNGFDFGYYMKTNQFDSVDYVLINLGTNDVAQNFTEAEIINWYQKMIDSIKKYNDSIIIGLWLAPTRAICGNYAIRYYIDLTLRLTKALIETYDGREHEGIYLIPIIGLDNDYDYNITPKPVSTINSDYTQLVCDEAVHPSPIGYEKIAAMIYPYIKYWGDLT